MVAASSLDTGPGVVSEQDREQSCAKDVAFYHVHERGGSIRRTPSR